MIYLDAIVVKVRDGSHVRNKAAHIAVGVDMDGIKHVLGIWIQQHEGAKFWAGVCANLSNRGVGDVIIVCCDGLVGLPEAIEATWPHTTIQTCVVHLIRAAMRFVGYGDRKAVAAALKPIYTSIDASAAEQALTACAASPWGGEVSACGPDVAGRVGAVHSLLGVPAGIASGHLHHDSIESLNYQLRKVTKNHGHFPTDDAVVKLLWLAICNIEDKRARERAKERGKAAGTRKASGRLVEGQVVTNWN